MLKISVLIMFFLALTACVGAEEEESWVVREDTWDLTPEILESFKALFLLKSIDGTFHPMDEAISLGDSEQFIEEFVHKFSGSGKWAAYRMNDDFSAFFLVDEDSNILAAYLYPFLVLRIFGTAFKADMEKNDVLSLVNQYVVNTDAIELELRSENNKRSIYTNADSTFAYYSNDFTNSIITEVGDGSVTIGFLTVRTDGATHPKLSLKENKYWIEEITSGEPQQKSVVNEP